MVVPLDKDYVVHSRYEMLSPQPAAIQEDEDDGEINGLRYVSFIKTLPSGTSNKDESARPATSPKKLTPTSPSKSKSRNPLREVQKIKQKNKEVHAKKLKEIEDCKFNCKQHDRVLKRVEGDIVQKGKKLKKTMKELESNVYKKQRKEEETIVQASMEEKNVKQQNAIENMKLTKDRIHRNTINLQKEKETDLKVSNAINQIEQRYGSVAEAIHLKRIQMNNLVKEFEKKVQHEEEEEFRLKQEFAKLTLELNMEAKKKREESSKNETFIKKVDEKDRSEQLKREVIRSEKMKHHKGEASRGELGTRKLSLEKANVLDSLKLKEREDGRRLRDVKVKIQDNALARKRAQIKGDLIDRERLGAQSAEKVMAVSANRKIIQDMISDERKQKNDLSMDQWRQRNFMVNHANKLVSMDDNISHFQKYVTKQENTEQYLYGEVKKVEYDRKKQEQTVDLMKQELLKLQKQNKLFLLETEKQCKLKEEEIKERLRKEEAQLGKALSEREEKIQSLNRCRSLLFEDKHMLGEELKVRNRLIRIEEKSTVLRSSQEA